MQKHPITKIIVQPHKHESHTHTHTEALDPVIRIVPDNSTSQNNKIIKQTSNHTKLELIHMHIYDLHSYVSVQIDKKHIQRKDKKLPSEN